MTFEVQLSILFVCYVTKYKILIELNRFVVQKSGRKLVHTPSKQIIFFHMYLRTILSIYTDEQTPMLTGFKIDLEMHLRMHKQHIYKRQKKNLMFHSSKCFFYHLLDCYTVLYLIPQCQQYLGLQVEGFVGESLSTPLEEGTEDQIQNFYWWSVNTY